MAQSKGSSGEGLSPKTLVIAAAASAVAAVVVSHFWKGGTVVAAAMTPVIVSVMKDLLARPMESEIVKRPVQQVSRIASGRIVASAMPRTERVRQAGQAHDYPEDPRTAAPLPPTEQHRTADTNGDASRPEVLQSHPRRTYGGSSRRRRPVHLKVAIITGLLAFVIAALVLTVPELVLGGAVSSHHSTTLFGGGSSKAKSSDNTTKDKNTTTKPATKQPQNQQTTPTTPAPTTGAKPPPSTTPAPPTTPQAAPTTPQAAPPPSSGGTSPPAP